MALKQMLKKQEESETIEKVIFEKRTQLEEKKEEIKRLKTKLIIQEQEKKKVNDELRKGLKDLKTI